MEKKEYKLVRLLKNSVQPPEITDESGVLIWIDFSDLNEFTELVGSDYFSDCGLEVTMMDGYICFDGSELLECFNIDLDVFDE